MQIYEFLRRKSIKKSGRNGQAETGIGDGAIIGLNSVVSKDVEPYTIVAGNPARFIRKRFDDELIELLQRLKWWDKSVEEIQCLIPILTDSNLPMIKDSIRHILETK